MNAVSLYFHSRMRLTWTPVILVVILMTCQYLTSSTAQIIKRPQTVTKAQIEEVVKRFYSRFGSEEAAKAVERILDCTRRGLRGCNRVRRRSMVIKEILLRLRILDFGENCTSSDGNYTFDLYDVDYDENNTKPYQAWQNEFLNTGLTFCNPFKHLDCSPIFKKCYCRPGTFRRLDISNPFPCQAKVGGNCWIPGALRPSLGRKPLLFDPFTDKTSEAYDVIREATCLVDRLRGSKRCTDLKLFQENICDDIRIREVDKKLDDQFKDLPRLNFGDSCNFEHQTQLFTTTEEEGKDYEIRIKKLEAIVKAKTTFCNHSELLTCGSEGKCECMEPSIYNNETKSCTFKGPHKGCEEESRFKKMVANYPGRVNREFSNGFEDVLKRECQLGCDDAKFSNGKLVQPPTRFCRTCPFGPGPFIGKNCDKDLTRFLEGAPPPSFPIDIPDYDKQLELFVQFNEKAKEFEKLFRLDENSPCDYMGELDAYRSIRRIKNVEDPDKVFTGQNYKDLMNSMDKQIGQFGQKGLCRFRFRGQTLTPDSPPLNRPILLCGLTLSNSICYEPNNTFYLEVLMKRLSEKSLATPTGGPCASHPRDILKYTEEEFGPFKRLNNEVELNSEGYEYIFNTLENHWIDNSQFCNRTGGFKCSKSVDDKTNTTGKCVFSKAYLEEVLAEEKSTKLGIPSKPSHLSIQNWLPILLFVLLHQHILIFN